MALTPLKELRLFSDAAFGSVALQSESSVIPTKASSFKMTVVSGHITLREPNGRAKKRENQNLFHNNLILVVVETSMNYFESEIARLPSSSPSALHCFGSAIPMFLLSSPPFSNMQTPGNRILRSKRDDS
jgi:hypothetical protein